MKQVILASMLMASVLSGCATNPALIEKHAEVAAENQMILKEQSDFEIVLERPFDRSGEVQNVYVEPLKLDQVEVQPLYRPKSIAQDNWELTDHDQQQMQRHFEDALKRHFTPDNGLNLVTSPEQADLVVKADVTELFPSAPKDDNKSRDIGMEYFSEGFGEATILISVYQQDQLVFLIEDRRQAGMVWERNERLNNTKNIRILFRGWANDLADQL